MKLVRLEAESGALRAEIRDGDILATSTIGLVEVRRGLERWPDREASRALWREAEKRFRVIELDAATIEAAATVPPVSLKSLNAIHLATALVLQPELDAFVVYDRRLADAAAALGLPVSAPGATA